MDRVPALAPVSPPVTGASRGRRPLALPASQMRPARAGELVDAGRLNPHYHRLSQAERERLERLSGTNS